MLIDPPAALQRATVERLLRPTLSWTFPRNLAMGFLLDFPLLQGGHLRCGQHVTLACDFGFSRSPPFVEILQALPLPHPPDAGSGDRHSSLRQVMRGPSLAPRRLLSRQGHHRFLKLGHYAILAVGLAPPHLLQRRFPPFVLPLFAPRKTLPTVPHHVAGWEHGAQLLGSLQQPDFALDPFLRGLPALPLSPLTGR